MFSIFFETYDYGIYQNWFLHFWELWLYVGEVVTLFFWKPWLYLFESFDNHPTPMTSLFWILGNKKIGWMQFSFSCFEIFFETCTLSNCMFKQYPWITLSSISLIKNTHMLWVRIGFEIPSQHDTWPDDHLMYVKVIVFVWKTYSKNISSFLMHFS